MNNDHSTTTPPALSVNADPLHVKDRVAQAQPVRMAQQGKKSHGDFTHEGHRPHSP